MLVIYLGSGSLEMKMIVGVCVVNGCKCLAAVEKAPEIWYDAIPDRESH